MRNILATLFLLTILGTVTQAQDGNNTMYFLSNLPQRVRVNPAYQPEYNVQVGLPILSGVQVGYYNTSFRVNDLLKWGKGDYSDSVVMDINGLHAALKKQNNILLHNENSILTVGFRVNSWYATLDITQKNEFNFAFNKDIFTFLKEGNTPWLGKTFDMGGLGLNVSAYEEIAFGLSKKVNNRLTVGGRLKVLMGIANADMTDSDLSVTTAENGESLKLHSRQNIRVSAPLKYKLDGQYLEWDDLEFDDDKIDTKFFMNTSNLGFGIDLGGEYQLTDKIQLHASVLDLGFIRWGTNTHRFTQNTTFDWEGADISNSMNENDPNYRSLDDAFEDLLDSLKNDFRLTNNSGAYTTMLQAKFYAGATYQLHDMVNVGGVFKGIVMNKRFYPSLSVSANARLLRNVSASIAYTAMRGDYTSLGAGITAKLGPFQLYAVADNLLAVNYTAAKNVNMRFGINLLFGHKDSVAARKVKKEAKKEETETPTQENKQENTTDEEGIIF